MNMKTVTILFAFVVLMTVACQDKEAPDTGLDYLHEALDVMEANALYRKSIDWTALRNNAHAKVQDPKTIEGVFPAIEFALKSLGDNHSTFYAKNSTVISGNTNGPCQGTSAEVSAIAGIGYVKIIPTASDITQHSQYATDLQQKIKSQDNANIKGWIVDLRGNTGGYMAPMLAGIGPLIGNGVAGYFIDADDKALSYSYNDGITVFAGATTAYVTSPYRIINTNTKIAVLIDQRTASSGEGIAIALLGFPNTKSFGVATCGQSTSVGGYDLSDGATLALANAYIADRNKKKNGGSVIPDLAVAADQEVVNKAVEWINQP